MKGRSKNGKLEMNIMKNERVIEFLKKLSTNEKAVKFLAERKNGS